MLSTLILAEILASAHGSCPRVEQVYKTLTNVTVQDLSKPYLFEYYEVYGTRPDGKQVELYLAKHYICNYGSFGGGGCGNQYSCNMKVFANKSAYQPTCEAICAEEARPVADRLRSQNVISGDSIEELESKCEYNLYSTTEYRVQARYLRSEWRVYDTPATETNSCKF